MRAPPLSRAATSYARLVGEDFNGLERGTQIARRKAWPDAGLSPPPVAAAREILKELPRGLASHQIIPQQINPSFADTICDGSVSQP